MTVYSVHIMCKSCFPPCDIYFNRTAADEHEIKGEFLNGIICPTDGASVDDDEIEIEVEEL